MTDPDADASRPPSPAHPDAHPSAPASRPSDWGGAHVGSADSPQDAPASSWRPPPGSAGWTAGPAQEPPATTLRVRSGQAWTTARSWARRPLVAAGLGAAAAGLVFALWGAHGAEATPAQMTGMTTQMDGHGHDGPDLDGDGGH